MNFLGECYQQVFLYFVKIAYSLACIVYVTCTVISLPVGYFLEILELDFVEERKIFSVLV